MLKMPSNKNKRRKIVGWYKNKAYLCNTITLMATYNRKQPSNCRLFR